MRTSSTAVASSVIASLAHVHRRAHATARARIKVDRRLPVATTTARTTATPTGAQYGGVMTRGATDRRIHRAVQRSGLGGLLAAACLVLVGCHGMTQTPFQRTAREAAGTLAAAAETINAVQEGRLSEDGTARTGIAERLRRELQEVELLLRAPCLHSRGCDVSAQIRQLKAVSKDLLQASES
jgi:hypothetical protein